MKKTLIPLLLCILALTGCHEDDPILAEVTVIDDSMPSVTVIYSLSGPGDNGYNDMMVEGVVNFCDSANVAMHTLRPSTLEEARLMTETWMARTEDHEMPAMLVLAGNEYAEMAAALPPMNDKKRCILLVESEETDMPSGVVTASVDRRSVMYLAGALSARTPAYILGAMPGDKMVATAIDAFGAGYKAHQQGYNIEQTHYLANDEKGYAMPNDAYAYVANLTRERQMLSMETGDPLDARYIVLPMAGGSNTGVYFYMLQSFNDMQSFQAVIGVDVDYSNRLVNVPFSVVIRVDRMLRDCILTWMKGKALPRHHTYTMEEGFADVVLNPSFSLTSMYAMEEFEEEEDGEVFVYQDYLPADYWVMKYEELKEEAIAYGK